MLTHDSFFSILQNTGFIKIANCILKNDCWKFKYTENYISKDDKHNWCYAFVVRFSNRLLVTKIGGTGAKQGMNSRCNSYQSGNPKHNLKNGPQNRRIYKTIRRCLKKQLAVELYAFQCDLSPINCNVPWRDIPVSGNAQIYKIYENDLIKLFEEIYEKRPLWNRYSN